MSIELSLTGTFGAGAGAGAGAGVGMSMGFGVGADAGPVAGGAALPLQGSFMAMLAGFDPGTGAQVMPALPALPATSISAASAALLTAANAPLAVTGLVAVPPVGSPAADPLDPLQDAGSGSSVMLAPDPSLLAQMQMAMGSQLPAPVIAMSPTPPSGPAPNTLVTEARMDVGLNGFSPIQVLDNNSPVVSSSPMVNSSPMVSSAISPTMQASLPGQGNGVPSLDMSVFGTALPAEAQAPAHKAGLTSSMPPQASSSPATQPLVLTGLAQMLQPLSARTPGQTDTAPEPAGAKFADASAAQSGRVSAARAESRLEALFTAAPAVALGDSLRQWLESAKLDKPTQGSSAHAVLPGLERSTPSPSGLWNLAASEAHALHENVSQPAASDFAVQQQVADQVSMWVSQNIQSAELKLDALGHEPVEVSISLSGSEASVEFRSDRPEIRDLLSRATAQLSDSLQREGLVLADVSVGSSGKGRDNPGEPGDNARGGGKPWRGGEADEAPIQALRMTASRATVQGTVDLFV